MEIKVSNVTKKIKDKIVLDSVSAEFVSGNVYGLSGVNGSGKTMLMRVISGLIIPTQGEVIINGKKLERGCFPDSIGVLLEGPSFLPSMDAYHNLKLLADIRKIIDDDVIYKTLEMVGLDGKSKKKYKAFSLGMKQRLGIAAAIMESPEIIILDEPFNALDEEGVNLLKNIIYQEKMNNKIILISSHDKELLRDVSDEILVIENGKIIRRG